jgi:acetyl esterase/lipase
MSNNHIVPFFIDDQVRDTFMIIPGGGYEWTSPREGKPVAEALHRHLWHAAVFEYRHKHLVFPKLLDEAKELVDRFRQDSRIRRLFLIGFSAGGHLALMLLENNPERYNGGILVYPVVSSDHQIAHMSSIRNLLGDDRSPDRLEAVALEHHVPDNCPPVFLCHAMDDMAVDVENTIRLIQAMKSKHIPVEAHLFPAGSHGFSLGDETTPTLDSDPEEYALKHRHVAQWFPLMVAWIKSL